MCSLADKKVTTHLLTCVTYVHREIRPSQVVQNPANWDSTLRIALPSVVAPGTGITDSLPPPGTGASQVTAWGLYNMILIQLRLLVEYY